MWNRLLDELLGYSRQRVSVYVVVRRADWRASLAALILEYGAVQYTQLEDGRMYLVDPVYKTQ